MDYQCLFADDIDPDVQRGQVSKAIFYSKEQEASERPNHNLPVRLLQLSHVIENVRLWGSLTTRNFTYSLRRMFFPLLLKTASSWRIRWRES